MVAIGFLLFCYRGFARTQTANRSKRKAVNVFPLGHEKKVLPGNGKPLLAILVLSAFPTAVARAQTGGQSIADANSKQSGAAAVQAAPVDVSPAASLPTPSMTGPLKLPPPILFDAGPLGQLALNGILSGMGVWQDHPSNHDHGARADISNAQIFLQKTTGIVQFYLQAGAYNFPALGLPFLSTTNTVSEYFGPLPVAFLKIAPKGDFSFQLGKLPSPLGAENNFTFENMNIERGLIWNQENDVSRGVQLNYAKGRFSSSLSWNDGFYSNRFNWLTGSASYAINSADSIELVAGGNLGKTGYSSAVTLLYQNNSSIYDLIYTHSAGKWTIEPYFQYTRVPTDRQIGVAHTTSTQAEAVLTSYHLSTHFFLPIRAAYISSSGNATDGSVNLLYGPGSSAASFTITPTYQNKGFFAREEFSFVPVMNSAPGDGFGAHGADNTQVRGIVETGFIF